MRAPGRSGWEESKRWEKRQVFWNMKERRALSGRPKRESRISGSFTRAFLWRSKNSREPAAWTAAFPSASLAGCLAEWLRAARFTTWCRNSTIWCTGAIWRRPGRDLRRHTAFRSSPPGSARPSARRPAPATSTGSRSPQRKMSVPSWSMPLPMDWSARESLRCAPDIR